MCGNGKICSHLKENLRKLQKENYKEYIKLLMSVELEIEDENVLEKLYQRYIESDNTTIINTGGSYGI